MNIKDIDKISTSPRKGKKGFLKKLLGMGGGETVKSIIIQGDLTQGGYPEIITQFCNVSKDEFINICSSDIIPSVCMLDSPTSKFNTHIEGVTANKDEGYYGITFISISHGNSGSTRILVNSGVFTIFVIADDDDIHVEATR